MSESFDPNVNRKSPISDARLLGAGAVAIVATFVATQLDPSTLTGLLLLVVLIAASDLVRLNFRLPLILGIVLLVASGFFRIVGYDDTARNSVAGAAVLLVTVMVLVLLDRRRSGVPFAPAPSYLNGTVLHERLGRMAKPATLFVGVVAVLLAISAVGLIVVALVTGPATTTGTILAISALLLSYRYGTLDGRLPLVLGIGFLVSVVFVSVFSWQSAARHLSTMAFMFLLVAVGVMFVRSVARPARLQ